MFLCAEPLLIRLLRVLQVPTTSGDSGFLSCADTPSVLPPPVHFFFLSLSFFNFIYHFVSFCHLHSVDQKPRDNLMSWHFFLCVFNSLQTFALNSTSASAGAGVPVVLILFFFFSFFLDQLLSELDCKSSFPFQNWLDTETSQTISLCSDRSDASRFRQKTPPHALTSVPSQGLDFATNSAVFLTTPNGTWPRLHRRGFYSVLDTNIGSCFVLRLCCSHRCCTAKATTFFCRRIPSKPLMKPLSKCWLPSFIAAPGGQSSVVIRLGAPPDLPSPVQLTIFCVLLRACAYWRCTGVYMHFSLVAKYIFLQNLTDVFWEQTRQSYINKAPFTNQRCSIELPKPKWNACTLRVSVDACAFNFI